LWKKIGKMKRFVLLLFVVISFSAHAQEQRDSTIFGLKLVEFRAGGLFSRYYQDNDGRQDGYGIDMENKFKTGFSGGVAFILINAKHFAFQSEIIYNLVHHDIKYYEERWSNGFVGSITRTYGNYSLDASFLQLSAMAKYKFGKVIKAYLGLGGYLSFPVYNRIKGSIEIHNSNSPDETLTNNQIKVTINRTMGFFAASGISIPYKRNYFGLEFRVYYSGQTLINYFNFKQSFFTVNLIYQYKRKKNAW
jgi:hypothetical protein